MIVERSTVYSQILYVVVELELRERLLCHRIEHWHAIEGNPSQVRKEGKKIEGDKTHPARGRLRHCFALSVIPYAICSGVGQSDLVCLFVLTVHLPCFLLYLCPTCILVILDLVVSGVPVVCMSHICVLVRWTKLELAGEDTKLRFSLDSGKESVEMPMSGEVDVIVKVPLATREPCFTCECTCMKNLWSMKKTFVGAKGKKVIAYLRRETWFAQVRGVLVSHREGSMARGMVRSWELQARVEKRWCPRNAMLITMKQSVEQMLGQSRKIY